MLNFPPSCDGLLESKTRSNMRERKRKLFKRTSIGLAILAIYILSIGPIVRITEFKTQHGETAIPNWVQAIYYPLFNFPAGPATNLLDAYLQIWIHPN
jgi:hypothetical protein